MARLSREDWLNEGLLVLHEGGPGSLTIDVMTQRLGVTKGSFYHHFASREDFSAKLLEHWEHVNTQEIIRISETADTPQESLQMLNTMTQGDALKPEVPIRAWAMDDDGVRAVVSRVDAQRTAYLQQLLVALGVPKEQGAMAAVLVHSAFIGRQHIVPPLDEAQSHEQEMFLARLLNLSILNHGDE